MDIDLRWVAATLSKNGVIEESGVSAAVMGHPALGIVWLANKLAGHGIALEAGHILLAGSFTRPTAVTAGDTIHADFGRSEEHTPELQSPCNLVCRLLLEKKTNFHP